MINLLNIKFQKGNAGVIFVFFVAMVIVVITLLPPEISPPRQESCMVGLPPSKEDTLRLPGMPQNQQYYDSPTEQSIYWGYPNENDIREYVLIRSNVPTSRETSPPGWLMLGNAPPVTGLWHTINVGERPEKPGYDLYYPLSAGEIDPGMTPEGGHNTRETEHLANAGLLLFVNKDPNTIKSKDGKTIMDVEIYQDKKVLDNPNKKLTYEEMFACYGGREVEDPHLFDPKQQESTNESQLQLEWFYLASSNYWAVHCKPAIYLYPPKKQLVNVKVKPAGTLTYTDPLYNEKIGWNVEVNPNGNIVNLSSNNFMKHYDYLYFESKVPDKIIEKPTNGWVIKSEEGEWYKGLEEHFNDLLPKLGLNEAQTRDFIEYWQKALPESPYYFVGIIDQKNVGEIEALEITPKPDEMNRVRIYFERLDHPKEVSAPIIKNRKFELNESKFKVVEWGGMVKNDLNHPFTCSQ